jgi:hypothetical protein
MGSKPPPHAARAGRAVSLRCPAHEDRNPSLSIRPPGSDGWLRVKCFRGCTREAILETAGLGLADLGPPRDDRRPSFASKAHRPLPSPTPCPAAPNPDDDDRRAKRAAWPDFQPPTAGDLDALANLRGITRDGLRLAVARGLLTILPNYKGHRAWVVSDASRNASQARRLDGLPWPTRDGGDVKALSLPGTRADWPVGTAAIGPHHEAILLLEGGPDLLAAHVFLFAENREANAAAVGLLGAAASIAPDALDACRGRRLRIVAHADDAGQEAAQRWAAQLHPLAARLDVVTLGTLRRRDGAPCKDLNDALHVDADTFEQARILHALTP